MGSTVRSKQNSYRYSIIGGGPDLTDETDHLKRWRYLIDNPSSSLTFALKGAYVNGRAIPTSQLVAPITVVASNPGPGQQAIDIEEYDVQIGGQTVTTFVPTNYINYLNLICQTYKLNSVFRSGVVTDTPLKIAMYGDISIFDDFYFAFEETSSNMSFDYEVILPGEESLFIQKKPAYWYSISSSKPNTLFETRSFVSLESLAGAGQDRVGAGINYWRIPPA